jgi:Zn-dependent peptidase ImmA (M78 family)
MIPTKEKLDVIKDLLACVLRIQDIDITVKLNNDLEMKGMTGDKNAGYNYIFRNHNEAEVYINTEAELNKDDGWYHTLIHEMIHIMLDGIDNLYDNGIPNEVQEKIDCLWKIEKENFVNKLAKVIAELQPLELLMEDMEQENTDKNG